MEVARRMEEHRRAVEEEMEQRERQRREIESEQERSSSSTSSHRRSPKIGNTGKTIPSGVLTPLLKRQLNMDDLEQQEEILLVYSPACMDGTDEHMQRTKWRDRGGGFTHTRIEEEDG